MYTEFYFDLTKHGKYKYKKIPYIIRKLLSNNII